MAGMKSTDLTRTQTDALLAKAEPMLGYLSRLSERIDKCGMGTEPLAAKVPQPQHAMQSLQMALHHLHCDAYRGTSEPAIGAIQCRCVSTAH